MRQEDQIVFPAHSFTHFPVPVADLLDSLDQLKDVFNFLLVYGKSPDYATDFVKRNPIEIHAMKARHQSLCTRETP